MTAPYAPTKLQATLQRIYATDPSPELFRLLRRNRINQVQVEARAGFVNVIPGRINGNDPDSLTFETGTDGYPIAVLGCLAINGGQERIVDVVAWNLEASDYPATLLGTENGADLLGIINCQCRSQGRPLAVHKTPLDWLRAGCDGVVPLNRRWTGRWLDMTGGPFVAEDIEHGRELRALLGRDASKHQVLIRKRQIREAA